MSLFSRFTLEHKDIQGFTLLELLLAIAIFAIVVSMAYGAYNLTFKVINNSSYHAKYGLSARVTLDRFVEDLESFHHGSGGFLQGENQSIGSSQGNSLSFTSTAHLVFDRNELEAGYATITYSVEEQEDTGLLLLYRSDVPFRPGPEKEADKGFLLCDGLKEVTFTYFDTNGDEKDTWDSTQQTGSGDSAFPAMVQLRLDFAAAEVENGIITFSTGVALPRWK